VVNDTLFTCCQVEWTSLVDGEISARNVMLLRDANEMLSPTPIAVRPCLLCCVRRRPAVILFGAVAFYVYIVGRRVPAGALLLVGGTEYHGLCHSAGCTI